MKIVRFDALKFQPASHEDPIHPGVLKKVLIKKEDVLSGFLQMINWAVMEAGKHFEPHYHEDMDEVFVILSGSAEITVQDEKALLKTGDAVIIPKKSVHTMKTTGNTGCEYIAVGISEGNGGKTVNV